MKKGKNMKDKVFKHFNPMKLRDKYTASKTNNYSSFWMNDDWDTRKTSIFDMKMKLKLPNLKLI